jgi:hypothetical protein
MTGVAITAIVGRVGRPRFARWKGFRQSPGQPPTTPNDGAAIPTATDSPKMPAASCPPDEGEGR